MTTKLNLFLRALWALTRPFWFSEERWAARGLLIVIIGMNLGLVYLNVLFNEWNNLFFNALEQKDEAAYFHQMLRFVGLATVFIVVAVYRIYLGQMLQIRWRRWLTENFLKSWLEHRVYYRMQLTDRGTDNPDQRIAEDLRLFVEQTLAIVLGLIREAVTLVSFVGILWGLSGSMTIPWGEGGIVIPGYMVWAALVYAVIGTWLTHLIGRPLVRLSFDQQRYEADFRFALVRFRENAEGVALYRGEEDEARILRNRFANVVTNWWGIMRRQKKLTWLTAGYGQAATVFPYFMSAPLYFAGTMPLGGLFQTAQAFGQVQGALSWFVDAYTLMADWKATVDRLTGFRDAIEHAREQAGSSALARTPGPGAELALKGVRLDLPDGRALIADAEAQFQPGEAVLLTGPSGSGKSTLFRAIAGIWPFGRGEVLTPSEGRALFLPQRPYLPIGTLREVATYPMRDTHVGDEEIREALSAVGLADLVGRLDETQNWALQLSVGEQQRIAFARVLLQRPAWLFLDEATSALDEASESHLYRLVRARLPGTTIVSIGHRPTLAPFHDRRFEIRRDGEDPGKLVAAPVGSG
jgi:putative ATP-binding cassette transporter